MFGKPSEAEKEFWNKAVKKQEERQERFLKFLTSSLERAKNCDGPYIRVDLIPSFEHPYPPERQSYAHPPEKQVMPRQTP